MNKNSRLSAISRKKQAAGRKATRNARPEKATLRDYMPTQAVSALVATQSIRKTQAPSVTTRASGDGRICVKHREFVTDIYGSVNFSSTTYAVNPGLPITFPWLNVMAVGYESYNFKSLTFEYETIASTNTVGTVLFAADFDPTDAPPTSKTQLMAYQNAARGPVWSEFFMSAPSANLHKYKMKQIRYGNLSAGQDSLLFDVCNFYVATQNCTSAAAIGELYVSYEVELITPQLDLTAYATATAAKAVSANAPTSTLVLGTVAPTITGGVPILYNTTTGVIGLQVPGQYLVNLNVIGSTFAGHTPTVLATGGSTVTALNQTLSTTQDSIILLVQINNPTDGFTISLGGSGTYTSSVLRVSYYATTLA